MSQSKDKKKSFNSSGGGGSGYNSPKHNNSNNRNTNKQQQQQSPSHHNNINHHQHHQQSPSHQSQQSQQDGLSQMKDRTIYMSMSLIGQVVSVTLKNGDIYEGILSSTQTNSTSGGWGLVLKMARKKDLNSKVITTQPLPIIIIQAKDFLQLTATGVVLDHYRDSFMSRELFYTDTELSGFDGNLKERELTPWTPDPSFGESLEEFSDKKPSNWDQFEANEKLFGVVTSFDEDLYTTRLDKESEFYHKNQKLAERTAYEIENEKSSNIHLLEERGFIEGADYDEEERYSSVVRKTGLNGSSTTTTTTSTNQSSVYVPPSKRGQIAKSAAQKPQDNSNNNNNNNSNNTAATVVTATPTTATVKTPIDTSSINNNNNNNNITSPKTPTSNSSSTSSTPSTPSTPKSTTIQSISNNNNNNNSPLENNLSKESPNISKLRFGSQTIEQEAMGSPREGLSPRSVAYTRYRQVLLSEPHAKLKSSNQGVPTTTGSQTDTTPKSPAPAIVSNHGLVRALSLELATPVVPENVVNEFNNFKLKIQQHNRDSETLNLKTFSNNLVIKSKSRPGSPLIGSGSPRPAPTQLSLAATTISDDQKSNNTNNISSTTSMAAQIKLSNALNDVANEKKEEEKKLSEEKEIKTILEDNKSTTITTTATTTTTTTSSTTTTEKKDEEKKDNTATTVLPNATSTTTTTSSTTTTTMSSLKSRLKLNPNAKEFVPPSSSKLSAPKSTTESNTDSHTPINEIYYESMKKRQQIQESPNTVPSFWNDPYIRPYEEQMVDPNIYGYPPHMRAPHMGGVPFYPGHHIPQAMVPPPHTQILTPPPPKGMIHGGMIQHQQQVPPPTMGKAIHYNGPPPPGVQPPPQQPQQTQQSQVPPPGVVQQSQSTTPQSPNTPTSQVPPGVQVRTNQVPPPQFITGPNGQPPFVFAQPPFHPPYQLHHGPPNAHVQKRYPQQVPHAYAPQGVSPPPHGYAQPIIITNPPSPQNTMNLPPNQDSTHRYPQTYIQTRPPYHQNDQSYH